VLAREAFEQMDRLDDPEDRARAWMAWGAIHLHIGELALAADAMAQCAGEAMEANDPYLSGLAWYNRSYAMFGLQKQEEAFRCGQRAMLDLEDAKATAMLTAALTLVATIQQHQGKLQDALATLERSGETAQTQAGLIWLDNRATLADLLLALEQPEAALDLCDQLHEPAADLGLPHLLADLNVLRARALLAMGRRDEARQTAERALAQQQRLGRAQQSERAAALLKEARVSSQD